MPIVELLLELLPLLALWCGHALVGNLLIDCCKCARCEDDFDRSDDTDIDTGSACGWTESVGAWEIKSNVLESNGGGSNALAICTKTTPTIKMDIDISFKVSAWNTSADVILALVDSTHYYYLRNTFRQWPTLSTMQFFKNDGGTHTAIGPVKTIPVVGGPLLNTFYTIRCCVHSDGTFFAIWGSQAITGYDHNGTPTGEQCGLGSDGGGTVSFNNFVFEQASDYVDGVSEDCQFCQSGCTRTSVFPLESFALCCSDGQDSGFSLPSQMDVTLPSKFSNDQCSNCVSGLNGQTFALNKVAATSATLCLTTIGGHLWTYSDTSFCDCGGDPDDTVTLAIALGLVCGLSGPSTPGSCSWTLIVALSGESSGCQEVSWQLHMDWPDGIGDCNNDSFVLPKVGGGGSPSCDPCDFSDSGDTDATIQAA